MGVVAPFGPHCAFCALLSELLECAIAFGINALYDLRHNLAKVEVASSSLVSRSKISLVVKDLRRFR
jgi:hypothetical protein